MRKQSSLFFSFLLLILLAGCSARKAAEPPAVEEPAINVQESEKEILFPVLGLNFSTLVPDGTSGYCFREFCWGDEPEKIRETLRITSFNEEADKNVEGALVISNRELILGFPATVVYRFHNGLFFVGVSIQPESEKIGEIFGKLVDVFEKSYGEPGETIKDEVNGEFTAVSWNIGTTSYLFAGLGRSEGGKSILITYLNPKMFSEYQAALTGAEEPDGTDNDLFHFIEDTGIQKALLLNWGEDPEKLTFFGKPFKSELRESGRGAVITRALFSGHDCMLQYLFIDGMLCHVSIMVSLEGHGVEGLQLYESVVKTLELQNGPPEYSDTEILKEWWVLADGSTLSVMLARRDEDELLMITVQEEQLFMKYDET